MINTYNESDLHAALKKIYALESGGAVEARLGDTPWICDIIAPNGDIIEIQTANLSALTGKAAHILDTGRRLKIVHPVASVKWIETLAADGTLIRRKKSPKKATLLDSLRGMTRICPLLMHENCELEILSCEITETRLETEGPSQLANKSRRHLRNWIPAGKRLERIIARERLASRADWETLLPASLRSSDESGVFPSFRAVELKNALEDELGTKAASKAWLMIWILQKMGIIEAGETRGRSRFYRLSGR